MKKTNYTYRKLTGMTVGMKCQNDCDLQTLRGRVMLNSAERSLLFVQNKPQPPRSTEIYRTRHARLVRTHRGTYTLTFRFAPEEQEISNMLVREMAEVIVRGGVQ